MEIYTYLKKDHQKVTKLFKQIIAAGTPKKREQLFLEFKNELLLHAKSEQATFYKALKKHSKSLGDAKHGDKEHKEIEKALAKLSKIPSKTIVEWLVQFGELKHIVEHHVDDEEGEMFKDAKKVLSKKQANELTEEMEMYKEKLMKSKRLK